MYIHVKVIIKKKKHVGQGLVSICRLLIEWSLKVSMQSAVRKRQKGLKSDMHHWKIELSHFDYKVDKEKQMDESFTVKSVTCS